MANSKFDFSLLKPIDENNTEFTKNLTPIHDEPGTPEEALALSKQQISAQHPNMPDWIRDMVLNITPKQESRMLQSAARGITNISNNIPSLLGGALQGASIPIRGVSGLIPTEFTQKLAGTPDLRNLFPAPEGAGQEAAQMGGELVSAGGLLGKLMGGFKGINAAAKIPKALQTPLSLIETGAIGTPGDVADRSLGAGGALLLGGLGNAAVKGAKKMGEKLPPFFRGLTSKSTPEALVESVQGPHDLLQNTADDLYGQVRSQIDSRGIKIPVRTEYLDQVADILPKTRASRQLIEKAKTGDYDAIHDLQSHLYKKGTKGISSGDMALENQGEEIIDLRNKINDDLEKHLIKEGNLDIAHTLRQGKKSYATLMDTYFHKNLPKGIGKLVHPEIRLIPKKPEELFAQNSVPMKKFLEQHPEAFTHSQGIKEKEASLKALNKLINKTAAATGLGLTTKGLYDWLK